LISAKGEIRQFKTDGKMPALPMVDGSVFRVGDVGRGKPRPYKGVV